LSEGEALYIPTPQHVVDAMLRLANVGPGDVLYDLGSGDGRIPVAAARRYGIRAVGIELDARKIAEARCNARERGVEERVEFRQADVFEADFREASVVTLFLFPEMNLRLQPRLRELAPGTRVVSHRFDLGDWPPDLRAEVDGHAIFLWIVPPR
jgi:tRNA A58 N-methylase Trm61